MDSSFVPAALIGRLRTISGIDEEDVQSIRAPPVSIKHYRANQPVVRDGERPTECCLVAEGFCVRTKTTSTSLSAQPAHSLGATMPRFRFHIHENGLFIEDEEGQEFDDEGAVRREALETGASIARDVFISGTAKKVVIDVRNEDTPFLKISISLVVEEKGST
jgi:uncharacterized protein DUF6894